MSLYVIYAIMSMVRDVERGEAEVNSDYDKGVTCINYCIYHLLY